MADELNFGDFRVSRVTFVGGPSDGTQVPLPMSGPPPEWMCVEGENTQDWHYLRRGEGGSGFYDFDGACEERNGPHSGQAHEGSRVRVHRIDVTRSLPLRGWRYPVILSRLWTGFLMALVIVRVPPPVGVVLVLLLFAFVAYFMVSGFRFTNSLRGGRCIICGRDDNDTTLVHLPAGPIPQRRWWWSVFPPPPFAVDWVCGDDLMTYLQREPSEEG